MENHTQFLVDSFQRFIQDTENPKRGKLAKIWLSNDGVTISWKMMILYKHI